MANGLLGIPGLDGYLAGEQRAQRAGMNNLQTVGGLLGLQQQMMAAREAQEMAPLKRQMFEAQVNQTLNPAPVRVDLGDRIGLLDQRTNQIVGYIPKGATPDAALRERGATERHVTPSGSALFGGQVTMRGQDITDSRTRSEGALNRGVTLAGMNRPVLSEAAGGWLLPPPVGAATGAPSLPPMGGGPAPAPQPRPGYSPAVAGAFGLPQQPQAAPSAAPMPGGPQVIPVPGLGGGRAPQGYRFKQDGSLEPIPGGPADAKVGAAADKARMKEDAAISRADLVIDKVDKALDQAGFFSTGLGGAIGGLVPNSPGYNLQKTLDTVIGNIGFQELQAMREASPTGGALGQVAVRELEMLQSVIGSLDRGQSEEQLRENLMKVGEHFQNWKNTVLQSRGLPAQPNRFGASGRAEQIPGQSQGGGRTQPRVVVSY